MRILFVGLIAFVVSGCMAFGPDQPPIPPADPGPYRLDSGDVVGVIVFGQPDLSGDFVVSDTGTISVPLIGTVDARGLSAEEVAASVEGRLAAGLLVNPDVSVQVLRFRPFFILGEVATPGQYDFQPGMTVLTAVAIAGGFTYRANQGIIEITRVTGGASQVGTAGTTTLVAPGDVITVRERFF